jgi:uncharacterized protein (DUF433 family)
MQDATLKGASREASPALLTFITPCATILAGRPAMLLEDYFDFLAPDDIRIKGHRIGIETVLYEFIHRHRTPDQIVDNYRSLTLEEVYATILYYYHNQEAVNQYLADWIDYCNRTEREQELNPPPVVQKLRQAREAIARGEEPPKIDPDEFRDQIIYLSSI